MEDQDALEISFLDHIAIRVADMDVSAEWYTRVLGLKKVKVEKWGEFPIFLFAGKSGIALFPADLESDLINRSSKHVGFDHFAFNVDIENFKKARKRYENLGVNYTFKDHHYYHSIYTLDPDGYTVELTTSIMELP